ncbi:hypothetical protein BGX24_009025 [Mortierella sp. AD032]|nr:hypothetical protein BGX24_009025 [Mortierella sp. AD032]
MVSIRSLPLLAVVAIVASASAIPAVEPPTQVEAAAAAAATFTPPVGYPWCSTRPTDYMRCWEWCGKKGYWYIDPHCCCP